MGNDLETCGCKEWSKHDCENNKTFMIINTRTSEPPEQKKKPIHLPFLIILSFCTKQWQCLHSKLEQLIISSNEVTSVSIFRIRFEYEFSSYLKRNDSLQISQIPHLHGLRHSTQRYKYSLKKTTLFLMSSLKKPYHPLSRALLMHSNLF